MLWARIGEGKVRYPVLLRIFDVDAAMFLLLFFGGRMTGLDGLSGGSSRRYLGR